MSKILFVGAGNMGQAIINGMLSKGQYQKEDIAFYEIDPTIKKSVASKFGIASLEKLDTNLAQFDIIVVAVKPQVFKNFKNDRSMDGLVNFINKDCVVVSIMAGVTISELQSYFGNDKQIIRVMPNTPSLVGYGASVLSTSQAVSKQKIDIIKGIFLSIGIVEVVDERYLDAVTGLSGSGPAYVFIFIESLIQGGILCGLSKELSEKLAIQTVLGSAMMASHKDKSIEELRHMVTSPAGTTIEAISHLEKCGFRSGIIEAIRAATKRSIELGNK